MEDFQTKDDVGNEEHGSASSKEEISGGKKTSKLPQVSVAVIGKYIARIIHQNNIVERDTLVSSLSCIEFEVSVLGFLTCLDTLTCYDLPCQYIHDKS